VTSRSRARRPCPIADAGPTTGGDDGGERTSSLSSAHATIVLPAARATPRHARQFLADLLDPDRFRCEEALLCLSELVTNAVLHAQTEVTVRVAIDGRHVRVDVDDTDPNLPVPRHAAADAVSGRGLDLVARLSSRWGVDGRRDGKTVWFELDAEGRLSK